MRPAILAVSAALLLVAPAALAAPTCLDAHGGTIRCGRPGALPVGSAPTAGQIAEQQASDAGDLSLRQLLSLLAVVGGLISLPLLMPRFDGDWDGQEGDEK